MGRCLPLAVTLVLASSSAAFGEPYARKVVPLPGITANSREAFGAKMLAAAKVPDRAAMPDALMPEAATAIEITYTPR